MYQHIEFIDGSNPYISKTEKDFKWMCEHYVLIPIAENFWKATDRIYYKVVGFTDKNKMATFNRNYKSKASAMRVIRKAIKENKFECIVLRKEIEDLRNDEHFDISVSTPIKTWNLAQIGVMKMNNIFVIDKTTKCNLGILDFTPRKDDRISMKASEWKEIEVVVECVLYEPLEHATLVFVSVVEPYYTAMVKEIKW